MVLLVTSFVALTAITSQLDLFNVYIIPYAIVTILIRTFIETIGKAYRKKVGHDADFYTVDIGDGARKLDTSQPFFHSEGRD